MLHSPYSSYAKLIDGKGIIYGYLFEPAGSLREVGWTEIQNWQPTSGFLWLHLDQKDSRVATWLKSDAGLEAESWEALLAEESYPNSLTYGDALLVFLRGINLNPGFERDEFIAVCIFLGLIMALELFFFYHFLKKKQF